MATPGRRTDPPLERLLFEEPYRFDFFQAVRLLERMRSDRAPVGQNGPVDREVARFLTHLTLSFPASAIHRLEHPDEADDPPAMTVSFMGLTGPLGVLPYVYTELLMERWRAGDRTPAAFLDLFNHRMVSLFYRAWAKYRFHAARGDARDAPFARRLFDFIGLGTGSLRDRHQFPDDVLLYYAGFLAQRRRPAIVLEQWLRQACEVEVEVHQFEGDWLTLEPEDRSIMGSLGPHNQLGVSMILGNRVWDEQGKIRLRVGPLTFARFLEFLPEGQAFRTLSEMARLFVDGEFAIDVQLALRADEVPMSRLTSSPGQGPRLGRHAWLKSRDFARDADDAVFAAGA